MKYIEIAKKIMVEGLDFVGVRSLCEDEKYNVGDDCRESYEWNGEHDCSTYDIDGEDGELADGTCATRVEVYEAESIEELAKNIESAVKANRNYGSVHGQVIIAGYDTNDSAAIDENEIRIRNAFVLALIKEEEK